MLEWEKIDTVLLDMDGTLLDLNFDNHFWREFVPRRFAEQNEISLQQAKRHLEPRFKSMEGKLEWYCLDYWSETLRLDIIGLKAEISGLISVLPHVIEFLEKMQRSHRRVFLVTNAHPGSLGIKMEKTCLRPFFNDIISSHELGLPKEHKGFWPRLQQKQFFQKKRTLLVDDSLPVLHSARNFGIGYLLAISKPDSAQSERKIDGFPAIKDFSALLHGV